VKQAAKIIGGGLVTLLVASFVIYLALSLAPGDPATALAGSRATPEQIAALREQLGLDRPVLVRYGAWLLGVLHGDLGRSLQFRQDAASLIEPRLGVTFLLVGYAFVLILVFGLALGLLPSLRSWLSWPMVVVTAVGISIPAFVAALILIQVFALSLGWFPVLGESNGGLADQLWHLTLPAIALAISWVAYVGQITRASIREQAGKEHVETARGRGLAGRAIFGKHVLRNAAIPIVTIAGLALAGLVAGSIVVETAFGIGGIGSLLVTSVSAKDYDVVLAISMIFVLAFVVATTVADLALIVLDPRLRSKVSV
jgi:peptide/nickel transport system permease protein